jgi:PAS domain S-box-containing protein
MSEQTLTVWDRRLSRWVWVPVPLLAAAVAALWAADLRGVFDPQSLLVTLNLLVSGVAGAVVAYLVMCSFLAAGSPGLLLLGCGMLLWGLAGLVASALSRGDPNVLLTIHNSCVCLSAMCHLAGVCASLVLKKPIRYTGTWLGVSCLAVLAAVWVVAGATLRGAMPVFFVTGHGATPLRWAVLGSAVLMFAVTALILGGLARKSASVFSSWYATAMALIAVGLAGVMVQRFPGCAVSWAGRAAQYLGGVYMLVAGIVTWRESGAHGLRLDYAQLDDGLLRVLTPRHLWVLPTVWRYGIAAVVVVICTFLRWAAVPWMGSIAPNNMLVLAVILVTVFLGFGPGLLVVVLGYPAAEIFVVGSLPTMYAWPTIVRLGASMAIGVVLCAITYSIRTAQKQTERSQSRLAAFAAATFEGIAESRHGRIVDCNEQFAAMTGYTLAELKGIGIADLVAPEDKERVMANIAANRESVVEHAVVRRDGTRVIVETHGRPMSSDPAVRLTSIRDITDRKRAEDRLATDLAALTRMHELSGLTQGSRGFEAMLQEVMDAAVSIMGADKGTLQLMEGDSLRIVAHHGHSQVFLDFFASAENVASVCGEATRRGERVIVEDVETSVLFAGTDSLEVMRGAGIKTVQSTPLMSREGELLGILTTQWCSLHLPDQHDLWRVDLLARQASDMIVQRRSQEALRRNEARWNAAIENFGEGAIIATESEQVIYWNPAARAMHGFRSAQEGIGPLSETPATFELWTPDVSHKLELDEWPMRRIKRGEAIRDLELVLRRPDQGWEKIVAYSGAMVETVGGERLIFLSVYDMTEQRKAEQALRKSREAALNLMEDAVAARRRADEVAEELRKSREELRRHAERLDANVRERTAELARAVVSLQQEVDRRKSAEKVLEKQARQLRQLAMELTLAEQRERRRLARVLHDDLQQLMAAAKMRLASLRNAQDGQVRRAVAEVDDLLRQSIEASRTLAGELSPPILHDKGLVSAIEWLQRWMKDKHGLLVDVASDGSFDDFGDDVLAIMFHSIRELLFNTVKHAQVKSASVSIGRDGQRIRAVISDDGVGFEPSKLTRFDGQTGGFGLSSIQERFAVMGGSLVVDSAPGKGSRFTLVSPPLTATGRRVAEKA